MPVEGSQAASVELTSMHPPIRSLVGMVGGTLFAGISTLFSGMFAPLLGMTPASVALVGVFIGGYVALAALIQWLCLGPRPEWHTETFVQVGCAVLLVTGATVFFNLDGLSARFEVPTKSLLGAGAVVFALLLQYLIAWDRPETDPDEKE